MNWFTWNDLAIRQPKDYSTVATVIVRDSADDIEFAFCSREMLDLLDGWIVVIDQPMVEIPLDKVLYRFGISFDSVLLILEEPSQINWIGEFLSERIPFATVLKSGDASDAENLNGSIEVICLSDYLSSTDGDATLSRHFCALDAKAKMKYLVMQLYKWESAYLSGGSVAKLLTNHIRDFGKRPVPEFMASVSGDSRINVFGDLLVSIETGFVDVRGFFVRQKTSEDEPRLYLELEDDTNDPLTLQIPLEVSENSFSEVERIVPASLVNYFTPSWRIGLEENEVPISVEDLNEDETYAIRLFDETGKDLGVGLDTHGHTSYQTGSKKVTLKAENNHFILTVEGNK